MSDGPVRFFTLVIFTFIGLVGCFNSSGPDSNVAPSSATTTDGIGGNEDNIDSTSQPNAVDTDLLINSDVGVADNESGGNEPVEPLEDANDFQVASDAQGQSIELVTAITQVEFRITVPAYQSDALQVKLEWGDVDLTGVWNSDELWTVIADLPANTQNNLRISFNDRNGGITLGSVEKEFETRSGGSEVVEISADEFNTAQWDADGDGISNLDELIAGRNPDGGELPQIVEATLEPQPIKTFRVSWNVASDAQFYRVLENPDGLSGFNDISGELSANTIEFDHYVSLFKRVNAQYLVQSCNEQGCTDSAPVTVGATLDNAIGYFKGDSTSREWFGHTLALSEDGTTLVVGAPRSVTKVFVFVLIDGIWHQQATLPVFGSGDSVSLSANGDTLAIGAPYDNGGGQGINSDRNDDSGTSSGAVHIYIRRNSVWQEQAYIKASNAGTEEGFGGDLFGKSVSLSANGNTLAIGAENEQSVAKGVDGNQNDNSLWGSGAAYLFVRSGESWSQQAYLKASNSGQFDHFGRSVRLSGDGNTLAVGAPLEDSAATGINGDQNDNSAEDSGAVYVFARRDARWTQQAYLKASILKARASFGGVPHATSGDGGLALSADGNTLAVGAREYPGIPPDDPAISNGGAIYVFSRSEDSWEQEAYVKASRSQVGDRFGTSVSLSASGLMMAVGAMFEDSIATGVNGDNTSHTAFDNLETGAAYIFEKISGIWQEKFYIKASNTGDGDRFGGAVSLSGDGNTLAIGAASEYSVATGINGDQDDNSEWLKGAVYLY